MEPFFERVGLFPDAKSRSLFLFALLDNCKYDRICPMCSVSRKDIISHALAECSKAKDLKKTLELKFKLYGTVPSA